ncbi:MAG: tetratricopeptide repeat protein [Clostridia bacterium]|nr:tetratricopeptide repeat protein [Clostridia bacterium]
MKKETFAEKLARKSFESAGVQRSWKVHVQAFGPILEPAFAEDFQTRIHLINALNHISNRDLKTGLKKLQLIEKACETDADKAAFLFCMGLCMEMANMKEEMVSFYQNSGEYGHSFYLPYLKVAKAAHSDAVFEIAEKNYVRAIQCLNAIRSNEQNQIILASVYTNYASCLTMMHRYKEAEEALQSSREILPEQCGRTSAEAILEAAKGEAGKARALTEKILEQEPALYHTANKMVNDILEKKHPHFAPMALPEGWKAEFWNWFISNEAIFLKNLEAQDYAAVFQMVQPKLKEVFPFMERNLEFAIEPRENFYQITFADFFMISLTCAYKELIEAVPPSLSARWRFDTAR